ncbi:Ig-like domain-containing protein [Peptostreptococcus canis]|uniref:Cna B-type domain-containing protein n=1 Tax=Peptostreptococcus canis TaxID=1159213 RepID=A0ABR6TL72_9FIRM|nr:Ig-like domain-containing protein [Peptostreptococcus canis]MBC2576147.1 Cna B-type domain-containing protein [Peptostreptococcus canis]MBP1998320.1 hypothetical protein [Peptostreptococcus canis]
MLNIKKRVKLLFLILLIFSMFANIYSNAVSDDIVGNAQSIRENRLEEVHIDEGYVEGNNELSKSKKIEVDRESNDRLNILNNDGGNEELKVLESVRGNKTKVNVKITDFDIVEKKQESYETPKKLIWWKSYYLKMNWEVPGDLSNLKAGDYFEVILPDKLRFPDYKAATHFDLMTPDGKQLVAKAVVSPNKDGGGKVTVTFEKYVESPIGKKDLKGTMYLAANLISSYLVNEDTNIVQITIDGKTKPFDSDGPRRPKNEVFVKWSERLPDQPDNKEIKWVLRINHKKGNLENTKIEDKIEVEKGYDPSLIAYVPNSFELHIVKHDEFGNVKKVYKSINISSYIELKDNNRSFSLNLNSIWDKEVKPLNLTDDEGKLIDGINERQLMLTYRSNYINGYRLRNKAKLIIGKKEEPVGSHFESAQSGGEGSASTIGKLKIHKIDKDNVTKSLPKAEFIVENKKTGKTFKLITDDNGEAISEVLEPGSYDIKEVIPPPGYIKNNQTYTYEVKGDKVNLIVIKNERYRINIPVEKVWIDFNERIIPNEKTKNHPPITVTLKRKINNKVDDKFSIIRMLKYDPNPDISWKYTFEKLELQNDNGEYYTYFIEEDKNSLTSDFEFNKYDKQEYTGKKGDNGLINASLKVYNKEKKKLFDLPVEKLWQNTSGQIIKNDSLPSVEVKLYRKTANSPDELIKVNGKDSIVLTRDGSGHWKYVYKNLDIKDKSGDYYTYEIREVVPKGFTEISEPSERILVIGDGTDYTKVGLKLKNKVNPVYPATGGIGSIIFVMIGMSITCIGILYRNRKDLIN